MKRHAANTTQQITNNASRASKRNSKPEPREKLITDDYSGGKSHLPIPCVNGVDDERPLEIEYLVNRVFTPSVKISTDPGFLCGCDCTDGCRDKAKCACARLTYDGMRSSPLTPANVVRPWDIGYTASGRLAQCVKTGLYECNDRCHCASTAATAARCVNRVVQRPSTVRLQLFRCSKQKGWGVRCLENIRAGTFVCRYEGEVQTDQEADRIGRIRGTDQSMYLANLDLIETAKNYKDGYESDVTEDESNGEETDYDNYSDIDTDDTDDENYESCAAVTSRSQARHDKRRSQRNYKTQLKKEGNVLPYYFPEEQRLFVIDAKIRGNISRFFNHACYPNLFVQSVMVDTHDLRLPTVAFFAAMNIEKGSELTWYYGYEKGSVPSLRTQCLCGCVLNPLI